MYKLLLLPAVLLLLGCGGSSQNDGSSFSDASGGTGVFLDSPVAGVQYRVFFNDGNVGDIKVTDSKGRFSYEGDTFAISFFLGRDPVGRINLGSSTIKPTITLLDLLPEGETRAIDHPKIVAMAQLLQSLDDDGNITDTINISSETLDKINAMSMDSADTLLDLDNDPATKLANVLQDIMGDDANLIPTDSAQQHFKETLTNIADDILPLSPRSLLGLYFDTNGDLCFYPDYPIVTSGQTGNIDDSYVSRSFYKTPFSIPSPFGDDNIINAASTHTIYYLLDELNAYISTDSNLNADNYETLAKKYTLSNSGCISGLNSNTNYYGLLEAVNAYGSTISKIYTARATPVITPRQQADKDSTYYHALYCLGYSSYKYLPIFPIVVDINRDNLLFDPDLATIDATSTLNIVKQQLSNLINGGIATNSYSDNSYRYEIYTYSDFKSAYVSFNSDNIKNKLYLTANQNILDFLRTSPLIQGISLPPGTLIFLVYPCGTSVGSIINNNIYPVIPISR